MSSPRKYSSPYLTGLPRLSNPSPSKAKRRSKTSITKPNSSVISNDLNQGDSASDNSNPLSIDCNQVTVDHSAGDVDNLLKEIEGVASALKATKISNESPDIAKDESGPQAPDSPEVKSQDASNTPGFIASAEITAPSMGSSTSLPSQEDESKDKSNTTTAKEPTASAPSPDPDSSSNTASSLKSILKPPTPYYKNKPKPVKPDGGGEGSSKKFATVNVKDLKMKTGKFGGRERDSKEREHPTRSLTKHRHGHSHASATAAPSPITKIDLFQQQQGQINMKSARRRSKGPHGGVNKKGALGAGGIPIVTKKSVRFAHKIDVYPVPYEARAGTRACDWQRNMLEQRVLSFRQLMKDVGSSPSSGEELDMFGNGLIFPGYPYHLPNPNFAMRGRVRNFKF